MVAGKHGPNGVSESDDNGLVPENKGLAIELDQQTPKPSGLDQKGIQPGISTPRAATNAAVERIIPKGHRRTVILAKGQVGRGTLFAKPGYAGLVLEGHASREAIDQEAQRRIDTLDQKIKELTFEWSRQARALIINGNRTVARTSQPKKTQAELIAELSGLGYLPGLWANLKLKLRALTTTDKEEMEKIINIQELTQQLESVENDIRQLEKLLTECQNKSEQGAKITHYIDQRQGLSGDLEIPATMIAKQRQANYEMDPHSATKLGMEAMDLGFYAAFLNVIAAHHACTEGLGQLEIAIDTKINALAGIETDQPARK